MNYDGDNNCSLKHQAEEPIVRSHGSTATSGVATMHSQHSQSRRSHHLPGRRPRTSAACAATSRSDCLQDGTRYASGTHSQHWRPLSSASQVRRNRYQLQGVRIRPVAKWHSSGLHSFNSWATCMSTVFHSPSKTGPTARRVTNCIVCVTWVDGVCTWFIYKESI
jgi:hypothetical protein